MSSADRRAHALDFAPAFIFVLVTSSAPVLVSIVGKSGFDPFAQNFYRYLGALAVFVPVSALAGRSGLTRAFGAWRRLLPPAAAVAAYQTSWVMGVYRTTPTLGAFAAHSSVVYGLLGGAVFFADERKVVWSWRFLVGAAVVVAGFVGVAAGRLGAVGDHVEIQEGFGPGVALLCLSAVCWGAYGLLVKRAVTARRTSAARPNDEPAAIGPLSAAVVTVFLADLMFLPIAIVFGDLVHTTRASWGELAVLFGSGVACVGVAQWLYYTSICRIGVATSQVIALAMPFLAGLLSFMVLRERLTAVQVVSGFVLVSGVAWIVRTRESAGDTEGAAPGDTG